ncbi:MAG TPA: hypothetical protein VE714_05120 [Gemmatimonadales bacterium]|jgi:hypothetical protein|nr:hypothetical protein [Gemmatimonadales bacterium]
MRILVLGYIVRGPLGGYAWHHLQYVLGLAQLGHDVYFFEDSDDYAACYDPSTNGMSTDPSYGLAFAERAFERLGLSQRWAYHDAHRDRWYGMEGDRVLEICASADVALNVSGVNPVRPWWRSVPVRVFIDTDPAFTQIRHLSDPTSLARAREHSAFVTFGENFARSGCMVPDDGLPWHPTRQPIVLDAWPVTAAPSSAKFTSVLQWDSYPARVFRGQRYGMKSESFGPHLDLPAKLGPRFELAVGSPTAPRELLRDKGWVIRDPLETTRDPWSYQGYIQESKAEFSVAKHGYVVSRSGWFSERSAAYLASGRPVVVEQTGFSDWLQTDGGVVPFSTPEQAAEGIADVNARYDFHSRAARACAETYFDARNVLARLLEVAVELNDAGSALRARAR